MKLTPLIVTLDTFVQANGVQQGSVLSPALLNVMIDDILSPASVPRDLKHSLYAMIVRYGKSSPGTQFSAERVQLRLSPFIIELYSGDLGSHPTKVSRLFSLEKLISRICF